MNRDGLAIGVALAEVIPLQHPRDSVPLQHPRDSVLGRQMNKISGRHPLEPARIEQHFGFIGIQNLKDLFLIGLSVFQNLLAVQRFAGDIFSGRIADHAGEIADQKHDVMAEFLKLSELVDQHGVPEMQIGRGGIETGLDPQRPAGFKPLHQFLWPDLSRSTNSSSSSRSTAPRLINSSDSSSECMGHPHKRGNFIKPHPTRHA